MIPIYTWGRCAREHMVVGFTDTCAISVYHHLSCEFKPRSWRGVLDTTLCDKICQWLGTDWWFSPDNPVSSNNKTDRLDITEILVKVALNTINQNHKNTYFVMDHIRHIPANESLNLNSSVVSDKNNLHFVKFAVSWLPF